jgi:hypothetical protein
MPQLLYIDRLPWVLLHLRVCLCKQKRVRLLV